MTMAIRGFMWRDGRLVEQDEHILKTTVYFTNELQLMLDRAGFSRTDRTARALRHGHPSPDTVGVRGFRPSDAYRMARSTPV